MRIILFKHKFTKLGFSFLISLNSGKYLPACLINQIGFIIVFLFIIQLWIGVVIIINKYICLVLVIGRPNRGNCFFRTFY